MSVPKHIVALIDAKNEEIMRLEREKAESEHALGFAIDRVEHLEAEKAEIVEMLEKVNSKLYYCDGDYYWYEATFTPGERDEIQAAIRKARGEE